MRWQSVAGVTYHLLRSTNLAWWPPFELLATNVPGQAGSSSFLDTDAAGLTSLFYRVGVGNYVAPSSPPAPALVYRYNAGTRRLELSWSAGWFHLEAQTNGLGTNWFDYPGSPSSLAGVPVESGQGAVFCRLAWPGLMQLHQNRRATAQPERKEPNE